METHGRARDKARFCFFDMGMRHARAAKPWTTIHRRGTLTWVGEKRTKLGMAVPLAEISPSPLPDPYSQPPLPFRPVHVAASYANISEHLIRFELQCFQQFDNIDATLQQSCQHLPISSLGPPRKPSSDEDI
ncbi:hypothetical protein GOBAR_AA24590 [Gossypium barbadense]|uniref:Uncharacterized protein n=1 Tax=Gossypium barbadense TaxID=3634 RepID=A0A2P5WYG0_GOSBA|nr:hypothetical protein GOBAR_AA24590 [Gossypium barbadense]